MFNVLLPGNNY